jgi:hypothetical protein
MSNENISTTDLLKRLFKTSSLNRFINYCENALDKIPPFHEYINGLCLEKKVPPEHIIKKADIARTYGHQLFTGVRKPTRDRVIQLAFGFEMDYKQTQYMLFITRKSTLHPKIKRDAIIIYAIKNGYDINAVQSALHELSLPLLGEER